MTDQLPQNIESENALLGSVLINPQVYYDVADAINADDFYLHKNRFVWEAVEHLVKNKTAIDLVTVTDVIDKQGHLSEIGGSAYLTGLILASPNSYNAPAYAKSVKDASIRRKIYEVASKAVRHAFDETVSATEAVERVQRDIANVQVGSSETDVETLADAIRQYDEAKDRGENVSVFPTKTYELNRVLGGGLWSGRVALLAGEAKLGKTLICWRIIGEIAGNNTPVLFISQEMTKRDLVERAISAVGKIPEELLQQGKLKGYETQYDEAIALLEKLPIWISQKSHWNIDSLRSEVLKRSRENGVKVVLVDHVKLLADNSNTPKAAIYEQLDWKTQELKALAKDANVAILAIYTLNSQGELSGGAAPHYNVDLALKLVSDTEYQEKRGSGMEKRQPLEFGLWLTEEYRRYGRFEASAEFKKDPDYPIIHDAFVPRGL